jgi:SAM-dependent methyltransferase
MNDPKEGERTYFARLSEAERLHASRKPFGDEHTCRYLMNAATLLAVMRPPPARVVEFGCGTGWLTLWFAECGYDAVGVDISPEAIAFAEREQGRRNLRNVTFCVSDYENVRIEPAADYVVFHDALHHADSPEAALRAAHNGLVERGVVLCIEPGRGHHNSPASKRAVHDFGVHENDMPPDSIIRYARAAGFNSHLVLPWPWYYLKATYRPGYAKGDGNIDILGRKAISFWRMIRWFFRTRDQGMVLLMRGKFAPHAEERTRKNP